MAREKIYSGKLLKLYRETHRLPGGKTADIELIDHPGAVLIVPRPSRNTVILIRQYRPVIGASIWELPAGTRDRKESALACARRELREETGYVAGEWKRVGWIYPAPGYTTERIVIYSASRLTEVGCSPEADEVIRVRRFSAAELKRLLSAGRIVDAKTICSLFLAGVL